jgi:uncharacterized protein (TIGR03067 family)
MAATLSVSTVKAATRVSTAQLAAGGVVSAKVAALAEGMVKAMFMTKIRIAIAVLCLVSVFGEGMSALGHWKQPAEPASEKRVFFPNGGPTQEEAKQEKEQRLKLEESVQRMCWSRDGRIMASLTIRVKEESGKKIPLGTFRIWDAQTAKLRLSLGELEYSRPPFLMMFDFTPDGKMLAISQRLRTTVGDDKVELWDVEKGTLVQTIDIEYARSRVWFAVSPDNRSLAVCGCDFINNDTQGTVRLFDIKTANLSKKLVSKGSEIISVTYSSDGKLLATGGTKGEITIWDLTTSKELKTLNSSGAVAAVAFSPDGRQVVSADRSLASTLWDLATGKARELKAPRGQSFAQEVAFSPDGRYVAEEVSLEKDGKRYYEVFLWDVRTAKLLREWQSNVPPRAFVNRAPGFAFTPDSKRLATLHDEKTVKFWDIPETVGQFEPTSPETLEIVVTYQQTDLEKLKGTWSLKSVSGRRLGPIDRGLLPNGKPDASFRWAIAGNEIVVKAGGKTLERMTFNLAPSTGPKAINHTILDGPSQGVSDRAIYRLEGDDLKVCYGKFGKRPAEWPAEPKFPFVVMHFQREAADNAAPKEKSSKQKTGGE